MGRFRHILVGLDGRDTDISTVRYAALMSHLGPAGHILFFHVFTAHDDTLTDARHASQPLEVLIQAHLQTTVNTHFHGGHRLTKITCEVVEGEPLTTLLHCVHDHNVDLLLVGKRLHSVLPGKLARTAHCPVLIVPEQTLPQMTRLLVAIDFSEQSVAAMKMALAMARAYGVTDIICQHVASLPHHHHIVASSDKQEARVLRQDAYQAYHRFIRLFDLDGLTVTPVITVADAVAPTLQETATEEAVDLMVVGARERSAVAALLFGSVTERLSWTATAPLLVAKEKVQHVNFLEALLHHT